MIKQLKKKKNDFVHHLNHRWQKSGTNESLPVEDRDRGPQHIGPSSLPEPGGDLQMLFCAVFQATSIKLLLMASCIHLDRSTFL